MKRGHIPLRSCTVCAKKMEKSRLLRIDMDMRVQTLSFEQGGEGRGLYVCPSIYCMIDLKKLLLRGKIKRLKGFSLLEKEILSEEIDKYITSLDAKEGALDGKTQN